MLPSMRWLFWLTPPADGPVNMAVDDSLMRRAGRTRDAVFRVYGWSVPTLSLGRNQRARDCYNLDAARDAGIGFVRRPTGGRALLHDREITYSVTLPVADAREARERYDFINAVLLDGLRQLGVPAGRATGTASLPPGLRPCFDVPARHEIAVDGHKLVGSAQWRHAGALLQHGSILIRDDQRLTNRLLLSPAAEDPPPAATLEASLGRTPTLSEVAESLLDSLAAHVDTTVARFVPESQVVDDACALEDFYYDSAWTWRR
jgi:lipoate-protein ligase A